MKWSEVIMVRAAGSSTKMLSTTLQDLMEDVVRSQGYEDIRVFHRENLETDICIVLFHSGKKTKSGGSPLGLRLVAALQEYSLVHHTVWNEIER